LPISDFVPEQRIVPTVRDDVINMGADRDAELVVTLRHHGRLVARAHPTERVPGAKQGGASGPPVPVPARLA